jgi:hypothetical protein
MSALTQPQAFLLEWLSKEDESTLGECQGADLDELVLRGFATIRPGPPRFEEYGKVALTDAGFAAAEALRATPPGAK